VVVGEVVREASSIPSDFVGIECRAEPRRASTRLGGSR
jgi:hypothetical protein